MFNTAILYVLFLIKTIYMNKAYILTHAEEHMDSVDWEVTFR